MYDSHFFTYNQTKIMELVLIGGLPASGKSTHTENYVNQGYVRLNRDAEGGSYDDLIPKLDKALKEGKNVVMDNLFAKKDGREMFIKVGKQYNAHITFILMCTSFEDAQFNACLRMLQMTGKILEPSDHSLPEYKSPNLFPVAVLYKFRKEFETPQESEGFKLVTHQFKRVNPTDWTNKAYIFDFDGTLRTNTGNEKYPTKPSEVHAKTFLQPKLLDLQKQGYHLLGVSNQSGIAKGNLTSQDAEDCFQETIKQLDVEFGDIEYCPHKVPPISCYCRKPGPALGVKLIHKYKLNPSLCTFVGDMATDKSFAERCGFKFLHIDKF